MMRFITAVASERLRPQSAKQVPGRPASQEALCLLRARLLAQQQAESAMLYRLISRSPTRGRVVAACWFALRTLVCRRCHVHA